MTMLKSHLHLRKTTLKSRLDQDNATDCGCGAKGFPRQGKGNAD